MSLPTTPTNPHYDRFGGLEAVQRLVDAFYRAMDELPQARAIRAMHAADLGPTRQLLTRYLSEWLGGPALYTPERGPPRLRRRHMPFAIDADAREAWMACMQQALAQTCADAQLRADLEAAFRRVAEALVNTQPAPAPALND